MKSVTALLLTSLLFTAPLQAQGVAFIGDSISTGGASHFNLAFDLDRLENAFADRLDLAPDQATVDFLGAQGVPLPLGEPRRLELSAREFTHPLVWMFQRFVSSASARYLDTEAYSWGNLYGRLKGFEGEQIAIAARDGEKSIHARQQVDRLLDAGPLPQDIFVFFTGNDTCTVDKSLITSGTEFESNIGDALRYLIRNGQPTAPTRIWLVAPLGISQIVTSPKIQGKKVFAFGEERSCRDLQSGSLADAAKTAEAAPADVKDPAVAGERTLLMRVFQGGTYGLCPTLFSYHRSQAIEDLEAISGAMTAYGKALDALAKQLDSLKSEFRVKTLTSASRIVFEAEDMANDCFHLNAKGQLKIAKAIFDEVSAASPAAPQ